MKVLAIHIENLYTDESFTIRATDTDSNLYIIQRMLNQHNGSSNNPITIEDLPLTDEQIENIKASLRGYEQRRSTMPNIEINKDVLKKFRRDRLPRFSNWIYNILESLNILKGSAVIRHSSLSRLSLYNQQDITASHFNDL